MAYFPDLSPYAYTREPHPGVVHVGWLDNEHPYATGKIDVRLIEKLRSLISTPVERYRGKHVCELCIEPSNLVKTYGPNGMYIDDNCSWAQWTDERSGNGEIRISRRGTTFAAPVLIVHYVEMHNYLPPEQFLKAVEDLIP